MLINPAQLRPHLQSPDWVIFDCRHDLQDMPKGARVYAEGHIPGAHFAAVETVLSGVKTGKNGRHPLPVAADFAAFLNRHGVTEKTQIVAYDDAGTQYAARLWWLARWIGLTKVAVLDGGWSQWIARGNPVTAAVPAAPGGGTVSARPDATRLATAEEVLTVVRGGGALVIDARTAERFRGEVEPVDPIAGRIPSAVNRFFKTNLNPDQTLRPPPDLKREFAALLGSWRPDQVVHQCGSGVSACNNLLAMEHAGLTGSRLYVGSWSEWIADPGRPIARG